MEAALSFGFALVVGTPLTWANIAHKMCRAQSQILTQYAARSYSSDTHNTLTIPLGNQRIIFDMASYIDRNNKYYQYTIAIDLQQMFHHFPLFS